MFRGFYLVLFLFFIATIYTTTGCLLQDTDYISGLVTADGKPIEGIKVVIIDERDQTHTLLSDEHGLFYTEGLLEGTIVIAIYVEDDFIGYAVEQSGTAVHIELAEFDNLQSSNTEENELNTIEQPISRSSCIKNVVRQALNYRDPLNHCYAACEIRRNCGIPVWGTLLLSYAKEVCDIIGWRGFCHDFSFGDIWADFRGMACSYKLWQSCYACCPKP